VVFDEAMTSPPGDEPHDIADTQMFRRFVAAAPNERDERTGLSRLWVWPGLLIPVIAAIVIVAIVLTLLLG
jgi:hypothetical protein